MLKIKLAIIFSLFVSCNAYYYNKGSYHIPKTDERYGITYEIGYTQSGHPCRIVLKQINHCRAGVPDWLCPSFVIMQQNNYREKVDALVNQKNIPDYVLRDCFFSHDTGEYKLCWSNQTRYRLSERERLREIFIFERKTGFGRCDVFKYDIFCCWNVEDERMFCFVEEECLATGLYLKVLAAAVVVLLFIVTFVYFGVLRA